MDKTDAVQKECHDHIIAYLPKCKIGTTYQDAASAWTFMKIAELELRIKKAERTTSTIGCPF